jgi:hypothetical protein
MSQFNTQSEYFELLVGDSKVEYRLATNEEVLNAARQVIDRRVRRGTSMTLPQLVRHFLRTKLAELLVPTMWLLSYRLGLAQYRNRSQSDGSQ